MSGQHSERAKDRLEERRDMHVDEATFALSARSAAMLLAVVNACLIGGLVVVATVNDAGALNTVALTLAILAFLIQIIVYVAQTWAGNHYMLESQKVNSDTHKTLAEIKILAEQTKDTVSGEFDRVLGHVLSLVPGAVEASATDFKLSVEQLEELKRSVTRRLVEESHASRVEHEGRDDSRLGKRTGIDRLL